MLRNKLIASCFLLLGTLNAFSSSSPTIADCTATNGKLGDANAVVRDFCFAQNNDTNTGKIHRVIDYAIEYYNTMNCTANTSIADGNCKKAASAIVNGVSLAFHLNSNTLNKIRMAVVPGSKTGCPCSSVSQ